MTQNADRYASSLDTNRYAVKRKLKRRCASKTRKSDATNAVCSIYGFPRKHQSQCKKNRKGMQKPQLPPNAKFQKTPIGAMQLAKKNRHSDPL